jgi:hypothetical protein
MKLLIAVSFLILNSDRLFSQEEPDIITVPEPPPFIEAHDFKIKFSEEQEKSILQRLNSKVRSELQYIKSVDEEKYWDLLRESQFRGFDFVFLDKQDEKIHDRNNKIFEYEIISESLSLKYQKESGSGKEKVKTELMKTLDTLFDLREEERKEQVSVLEKELKELKEKLAVRAKNKNEIIKRRFNELTGAGKYLEWD